MIHRLSNCVRIWQSESARAHIVDPAKFALYAFATKESPVYKPSLSLCAKFGFFSIRSYTEKTIRLGSP